MAIVFNCPQCDFPYKLKDELAGKRATCKNPECRQVITIPQPVGLRIADLGGILPEDARPNDTPMPANPADLEAAALAALSETEQEKQDTAAENAIPMTCPHCNHNWTEPFAKAGKNTLCPNEECRQRIKVPEPKKGEPKENWRTGNSGKPTLAKENFEKPADVMDAEARVVGREAWQKGGGAEQEYEPIPLKRRLFVWSLIGVPLLLLGGGIWAFVTWNRGRGEEVKMEPAIAEFNEGRGELDPVQAQLGAAILELAAGEHALHPQNMEKDKALALAHQHLTKAGSELVQASKLDPAGKAAAERYAITAEIAVALVGLGGTDEQVKDGERFRWLPEDTGGRPLRANETKAITVHGSLRPLLEKMAGSDFDTRAVLLRRLTRELGKNGQEILASQLPGMLFEEKELPEAKAIVALELYRPNRNGAGVPTAIATDLKQALAGGVGGRVPTPASAQTLWLVLGTEKAPTYFPPPSGAFSEGSRFAYVGKHLLANETAEAMELARKPGNSLPGQLRALALCGEWANDPGPAFDAALAAINVNAKAKKEPPPASIVLRLSQLAAAAGKMEQSKMLADLIPDEGLKAWAKGSALQFAAKPGNTTRVEDSALEVPDSSKIKSGHLWGRMWQARQNARSLSASEATKLVNLWPKGTVRPFGLAGIAVAQHDK